MRFDKLGEPGQLSAGLKGVAVSLVENENVAIEPFLQIRQQRNQCLSVRQHLEKVRSLREELSEVAWEENAALFKVGDEQRKDQ